MKHLLSFVLRSSKSNSYWNCLASVIQIRLYWLSIWYLKSMNALTVCSMLDSEHYVLLQYSHKGIAFHLVCTCRLIDWQYQPHTYLHMHPAKPLPSVVVQWHASRISTSSNTSTNSSSVCTWTICVPFVSHACVCVCVCSYMCVHVWVCGYGCGCASACVHLSVHVSMCECGDSDVCSYSDPRPCV